MGLSLRSQGGETSIRQDRTWVVNRRNRIGRLGITLNLQNDRGEAQPARDFLGCSSLTQARKIQIEPSGRIECGQRAGEMALGGLKISPSLRRGRLPLIRKNPG